MKFVDFLNEEAESLSGKTKDGLKFEVHEHNATLEFVDQFNLNYRLFAEIFNDDVVNLGGDKIGFGYKATPERVKNELANSRPRKYISAEIARHIAIDGLLESELAKLKISLHERSVKKNGREINISASEKYNRSKVLGTLVIRNLGLTDVELQVGKEYRKIKLDKNLFLEDRKQLAQDIKEALGL